MAAASHSYLKAYAIDCITPSCSASWAVATTAVSRSSAASFLGDHRHLRRKCASPSPIWSAESGATLFQIIGTFGVRIPIAYLVSRIPGATLFQIGLGTPASSAVQIVLCLAMFLYLERRQRREALCGVVTGP